MEQLELFEKEIMEQDKRTADERQVGGTHYKDMAIQPWDIMQLVFTREEFIVFLKCSIIKYSLRAGRKGDPLQDYEKAKHYKQKLEEVLNA